MIAGSFLASIVVFLGLLDRDGEERQFVFKLFTWLPSAASRSTSASSSTRSR